MSGPVPDFDDPYWEQVREEEDARARERAEHPIKVTVEVPGNPPFYMWMPFGDLGPLERESLKEVVVDALERAVRFNQEPSSVT